MSEGTDRLITMLTAFDARVQAAKGGNWSRPAPCDGWTARDVVDHVANNVLNVTAGLSGSAPQPVGADEHGRVVGRAVGTADDDPLATRLVIDHLGAEFDSARCLRIEDVEQHPVQPAAMDAQRRCAKGVGQRGHVMFTPEQAAGRVEHRGATDALPCRDHGIGQTEIGRAHV